MNKMKKEKFLKRIDELDEKKFNKFMDISTKILDLIDSGIGVSSSEIDTSMREIPVSEKLKNARKEISITQVELAKKLKLSKGQIGNIEAGIRLASKDIAKKLSDYFKTDIGYWL